jgi:DNA repair protein RadC
VPNSRTAYDILKADLQDLNHEEFWMILMDRGNKMIAKVRASSGGLHGTVADPKHIFKLAVDRGACNLILAHNHPSGALRPSEEDIRLTKKLCEGGRFLDIEVRDHLIITQQGYFSFADQGMLI